MGKELGWFQNKVSSFSHKKHYAHQAVDEFVRRLNAEISARVKSLIEDKHLYQSVTIDADIIKSGISKVLCATMFGRLQKS
jgi:hypothetical protein